MATNSSGYYRDSAGNVYDASGNHLTLAQTKTLGPNGGPLNLVALPLKSAPSPFSISSLSQAGNANTPAPAANNTNSSNSFVTATSSPAASSQGSANQNPTGAYRDAQGNVYDAQGNHLTLDQTKTLGPNGGPLNLVVLPLKAAPTATNSNTNQKNNSGSSNNNGSGTASAVVSSNPSTATGASGLTYYKVPVTVSADNPGGFDVYDSNGNRLSLQQTQTLGAGGGPLNIDTLPVKPLTGDTSLNTILGSLNGLITSNKAVIPPGLQITPALTQQFLQWAHQVVDPQTQQLINQHITSINSNLQQAQTDYENQKSGLLQDFGTNLATEQNNAGASGTAFSGLRNLGERNMAASTNRSLSSLAADTQNTVGQALNTAAAQVGSANANQFNLPNLFGANVSIEGGSRGSTGMGGALNFNYNPSNYTVGSDVSTGNTNVANQQANYLSQYGTLAGNNSARSMKDLIGGVSGLPSGYTIPSNLS